MSYSIFAFAGTWKSFLILVRAPRPTDLRVSQKLEPMMGTCP